MYAAPFVPFCLPFCMPPCPVVVGYPVLPVQIAPLACVAPSASRKHSRSDDIDGAARVAKVPKKRVPAEVHREVHQVLECLFAGAPRGLPGGGGRWWDAVVMVPLRAAVAGRSVTVMTREDVARLVGAVLYRVGQLRDANGERHQNLCTIASSAVQPQCPGAQVRVHL